MSSKPLYSLKIKFIKYLLCYKFNAFVILKPNFCSPFGYITAGKSTSLYFSVLIPYLYIVGFLID